MRISEYLRPVDVLPDLSPASKDEALAELAEAVADRHGLSPQSVLQVLQQRERLGSTGIGDGVAIPHGKLDIPTPIMLFARSVGGVSFAALDGKPVHLFFVLLSPAASPSLHLRMLATISRVLKDAPLRKRLLEAPDASVMHAIILQQDQRS